MKFYMASADRSVVGEYHIEDGQAHRRLHQANRAAILDFNREMRKNAGAVKTTSFGKMEFNIPISDFPFLGSVFPGLNDPNSPEHRWAWNCFKRSPLSVPYRLQEQKRGVNRGTHITT